VERCSWFLIGKKLVYISMTGNPDAPAGFLIPVEAGEGVGSAVAAPKGYIITFGFLIREISSASITRSTRVSPLLSELHRI
jgi:hypothetical protein